jgi:hypothetical protein
VIAGKILNVIFKKGNKMKLNRKTIRRMILKEMADMPGGEKALRGYMQGLPHERDSISKAPSSDYNLQDQEIYDNIDGDMYGDDDMSRDKFHSEVQAALEKLVQAGILGKASEGYYVEDGDVISADGKIDLTDSL